MPPPAPAKESVTRSASFEGMFVRALQPTGAFAEELRAVGVDLQRLEPTYPLPVWYAAVRVALRHVAGHLPEEAGFRLLGERFIAGFFDTLVGKMVAVGLPLLGPDKTVQRLARTWTTAQPTLRMETVKEAEGRWRLTLHQQGVLPHFCAGIIHAGLQRTGVTPDIQVLEHGPAHCVLQVRWS